MTVSKIDSDGSPRLKVDSVRAAGTILVLLFLIWFSARAGFATLLSTYATGTSQPAAAAAAVNLSPHDAEAHQIRGALLEADAELPAAAAEYTQAVMLRPGDYVLWLSLAHVRELNGDLNGAIGAARVAVQLAPYYAQPHWQLGNLLVRAGRADGGFSELRLAGASNPTLLPAIIDLAWQLSRGEVGFVRQAIQPTTPDADLALAEYLKKRGQVSEVIPLLRDAGPAAEEFRRRYAGELIAAKRFADAYSLWSMAHPTDPHLPNPAFARGFEVESDLDEPGFGWRANKAAGVVLSLDDENPAAGKSSLKIEFKGESGPDVAIISQLVMVESPALYRLQFAARTEEIVSGGLPGVTVIDASTGRPLGQSGVFPLTSNGWRNYTVDFTVSETTSAIQIVLQRERCSRTPCPIFGRLWLDNFSWQKL